MESWHLFISGQQVGPCTLEQVRNMAAAGELPADAMVFDQASQQWQALAQIPALAALAPVTYFCFRADQQLGPFTMAQLKEQLAARALAPADLVFIAASNDWQPLQASPLWPELAPPVAPAAPTVPAPPPVAAKSAPAADPVIPAAVAPVADQAAPAAATAPAAIQFPCKNHPDRESFLICRACAADFCEDCLVEIAGTRYCKDCQAAGKAAPAEQKANKYFGKLLKK